MSARRRPRPALSVKIATANTAEVRGVEVFRVLERLACPKYFQHKPPSGGPACWTIPQQYAADVVAMAEHMHGSAIIDGQQAMFG